MNDVIYDIKNPPKRKPVKGRVSRKHHYVMMYPQDLEYQKPGITGLPYASFFDSFLEDCVKQMNRSKCAWKFYNEGAYEIMTASLN